MTYAGIELNDYGNPRSVFLCDTCGGRYTIDPEPPVGDRWMWQDCMAPECESFDITRDVGAIVGFGWGTLHADSAGGAR